MSTAPEAPLSASDIIALRREAGLTQAALAECLAVNTRQVLRWERGEGTPPPLACIRIRYTLCMVEREEAERALGRLFLGPEE